MFTDKGHRAIRNYFRQGMVLDMDVVNAQDKEQDKRLAEIRAIADSIRASLYRSIEAEAGESEDGHE